MKDEDDEGDEIDYEALDPGVREQVRALRDAGFDTTDSGDGVSKFTGDHPDRGCAMPVPNIAARTRLTSMVTDAHLMVDILGPDWVVQASYTTDDRSVVLLATKDARA